MSQQQALAQLTAPIAHLEAYSTDQQQHPRHTPSHSNDAAIKILYKAISIKIKLAAQRLIPLRLFTPFCLIQAYQGYFESVCLRIHFLPLALFPGIFLGLHCLLPADQGHWILGLILFPGLLMLP
ncbi:hypothetical protein [Janthinobacterium agaricidamnosum]|uniref:hypothetical protein n=1 Tax=Janthinobacterium agaricidamnosum TaxID=55508 RepID=UPI00056F0F6D|nr:hypothetical protein [Janthinobacterium agaricidamnosum]